MRVALLLLFAACGNRPDTADPGRDATTTRDSSADSGADIHDAATSVTDAHVTATPDAPSFPYKLDLGINCHNDCTLIANPPSDLGHVAVGDAGVDPVDREFGARGDRDGVPIVLGLEPGTSYYDSIREWCGPFTGTFDFRISICTLPSYIPVNCGS